MVPETEETEGRPSHHDVALSGYRACAQTAVLHLLGDKTVSTANLAGTTMALHLTKRQAHVEYQKLLQIAKPSEEDQKHQLLLAAYKGCSFYYS